MSGDVPARGSFASRSYQGLVNARLQASVLLEGAVHTIPVPSERGLVTLELSSQRQEKPCIEEIFAAGLPVRVDRCAEAAPEAFASYASNLRSLFDGLVPAASRKLFPVTIGVEIRSQSDATGVGRALLQEGLIDTAYSLRLSPVIRSVPDQADWLLARIREEWGAGAAKVRLVPWTYSGDRLTFLTSPTELSLSNAIRTDLLAGKDSRGQLPGSLEQAVIEMVAAMNGAPQPWMVANSQGFTFSVLFRDFRWGFRSTIPLNPDESPADLQRQLSLWLGSYGEDYTDIIAVGASSCEGDASSERERAYRRAAYLLQEFRRAFDQGPSRGAFRLYSLNLGQFKSCYSSSSLSRQRRIVLLARSRNRGADPDLAAQLQKSAPLREILNPESYSSFDLKHEGDLGFIEAQDPKSSSRVSRQP